MKIMGFSMKISFFRFLIGGKILDSVPMFDGIIDYQLK